MPIIFDQYLFRRIGGGTIGPMSCVVLPSSPFVCVNDGITSADLNIVITKFYCAVRCHSGPAISECN